MPEIETDVAHCIWGCQPEDHERLGHRQFIIWTYGMYLPAAQRDDFLSGWEHAWAEREKEIKELTDAHDAARRDLQRAERVAGELSQALVAAAVPLEALNMDNSNGAKWMAPSVKRDVKIAVGEIRKALFR